MTAAAKNTRGNVLRLAVSGSDPVVVAEQITVTPSAKTRATLDATTHDGATEAMEFITDGVYDPGEITVEGHLIAESAADDLFNSAVEGGTLMDWEILLKASSGTAVRAGSGFVTSYAVGDMPVAGGKQTFTATIKVSGAITQATGS